MKFSQLIIACSLLVASIQSAGAPWTAAANSVFTQQQLLQDSTSVLSHVISQLGIWPQNSPKTIHDANQVFSIIDHRPAIKKAALDLFFDLNPTHANLGLTDEPFLQAADFASWWGHLLSQLTRMDLATRIPAHYGHALTTVLSSYPRWIRESPDIFQKITAEQVVFALEHGSAAFDELLGATLFPGLTYRRLFFNHLSKEADVGKSLAYLRFLTVVPSENAIHRIIGVLLHSAASQVSLDTPQFVTKVADVCYEQLLSHHSPAQLLSQMLGGEVTITNNVILPNLEALFLFALNVMGVNFNDLTAAVIPLLPLVNPIAGDGFRNVFFLQKQESLLLSHIASSHGASVVSYALSLLPLITIKQALSNPNNAMNALLEALTLFLTPHVGGSNIADAQVVSQAIVLFFSSTASSLVTPLSLAPNEMIGKFVGFFKSHLNTPKP